MKINDHNISINTKTVGNEFTLPQGLIGFSDYYYSMEVSVRQFNLRMESNTVVNSD